MKKIRIVFATKTQHSKALAEAIGSSLGVATVNVSAHDEPEEAELLFIVGGIYGGKCNPVLVSYAEKLDASQTKHVVLVTSSVSTSHRSQKELSEIITGKGIDVLDEITCTGGFLLVKSSHPNKQDIKDVVNRANEIVHQFSIDGE